MLDPRLSFVVQGCYCSPGGSGPWTAAPGINSTTLLRSMRHCTTTPIHLGCCDNKLVSSHSPAFLSVSRTDFCF
ncbi:hypothetical protein PILCRDRAFT_810977 [Piloderma croceum F 1598]|uniref:Uncharacterized protein n=1 Tax=Piloderma croceum (strain F 1598) TaxID=765440 RepID=A0A0C3GJ86_PILCF|nr:hypothetical protein PILCRDRAFT_810977 [Piloderma croceum F 1598]